jgi:putative hemolysin
MTPLRKGTYWASIAVSPAELEAAQCLRTKAFHTGPKGAQTEPVDRDCYDQGCAHMVIKDSSSGGLVCCFGLLPIFDRTTIAQSYSAQYYELSGLQSYPHPMIEIGRFCIDPAAYDGDILRLAWAALSRNADHYKIQLLFGCASFAGLEPAPYRDVFALLNPRYLAPRKWRPQVKAPHVFRFESLDTHRCDAGLAKRLLPPLLKTYLMMAGWVSDHAVVDHAMGTLHVFTGVELDSIPEARKRRLRAIAR